jgi:hypothetical protein
MRGAFQHDNCPSAVVRLPIQHSRPLHRVFAKYLIAPILMASLDQRIDRAPARRHHLGGHPGVWVPFCSGEARDRHVVAPLRALFPSARPAPCSGRSHLDQRGALVRRFGLSELARPYAECFQQGAAHAAHVSSISWLGPATQPRCMRPASWSSACVPATSRTPPTVMRRTFRLSDAVTRISPAISALVLFCFAI